MKRLYRNFAAAAIALPLAGISVFALAQDAAPAGPTAAPAIDSSPSAVRDASLSGRVAEVFGTKFILETSAGRILVETGPAHRGGVEVRPDEELTVTGMRQADGTFEAFMIRYGDGRQVVVRDGRGAGPRNARSEGPRAELPPAPPVRERGPRTHSGGMLDLSQIERIIAAEGYGRIEEIKRKGRHYEVEARDAGGNKVEIHINFDGTIRKVDLDQPVYDIGRLRQIVERAGYEWRGDVDRKGKHFEVGAVNPHGELVELHVDFSGEIYKEKRVLR